MLGFGSLPGLLGVLAFVYLAACFVLGRALRDRLLPPAERLYEGAAGIRTADGPDPAGDAAAPRVPSWAFDVPAAFVVGGIVLTSALYLLACLFDAILPEASPIHPLLPANLVAVVGALLAAPRIRGTRRQLRLASLGRGPLGGAAASVADSVRSAWTTFSASPFFAVSVGVFVAIGTFIMVYVFFVKDGVLYSGVTAFSDYSPHTAMIRSFSHGRNFPAQYAHFAGDGIRYHFLFLFFTGNLEFLGMRIDVAFNLLGTLGVAAFCSLLGALGVALTGRRGVFLLGPLLVFLRAGTSFVPFLSGLAKQSGGDPAKFLTLLYTQREWIGETPFDNWGIWSYNVVGNQRHLLFSGAVLLIVLFVFLPYLSRMRTALEAGRRPVRADDAAEGRQVTTEDLLRDAEAAAPGAEAIAPGAASATEAAPGPEAAPASAPPDAPAAAAGGTRRFLGAFLLRTAAWLPPREDLPAIGLAAGLLFLLPYWHGSVLLATLSILFVLAIASEARLAHLALAVAALAGSFLQTGVFAGFGKSVVSPTFYFGFVAPVKSVFGVLDYAFAAFGLTFVLLLLLFFYLRRTQATALAAFCAPFVLAFTVSILPEGLKEMTGYYILVNHKFIVLTFALANVFIAGLLCDLWARRPVSRRLSDAAPGAWDPSAEEIPRSTAPFLPTLLQRLLAVVLGAALMANGILDTIVYVNRNRQRVGLDLSSPLTRWVEAHTSPDDVFLTPTFSYHPFFLSGRLVFYGWPYFASSAGHDTSARSAEVKALYSGAGGDLAAFRARVEADGLSFAIIDDDLRKSTDYPVDEAFFERNFPVAASFPELGHIVIYDLRPDPLAGG